MRYLGGKTRLAKTIVEVIRNRIGPVSVWEPFCGGLSCTVELAKTGTGVRASDSHPALISMCQSLQKGWRPTVPVTEQDYANAKLLPDSDPMKGFIGFGCSFGGKYFGGFARSGERVFSEESLRNLEKQFKWLKEVNFTCVDFLAQQPDNRQDAIYCDPPYQDTTGYTTGSFDHALFWKRCQEWAESGTRVFVSEFQCPVPHEIAWSISRRIAVEGVSTNVRVDTLYEVIR